MKAIVTFTVPGGKRLIAKAVARMPEVVRARGQGRIFLKGGTTVSAVAEELVGAPMRISGRITPRGLKGARTECSAPHYLLVEPSGWRGLGSEDLLDVVAVLGPDDLVISGANLIDAHGAAALMGSTLMGGNGGRWISPIMAEGVPTIIGAGLEKLIPGSVGEAVRAAGRKGVDLCMGASFGLMPLHGQIVTEVEAVGLLAPVECRAIGRGGVDGAEGGVTLAVWGERAAVETIFRLALELREATTSGVPESMVECEWPSNRCGQHAGCVYKMPRFLKGEPGVTEQRPGGLR